MAFADERFILKQIISDLENTDTHYFEYASTFCILLLAVLRSTQAADTIKRQPVNRVLC